MHEERVFDQLKLHYGFRRVRYVKLSRNEEQFKFLSEVGDTSDGNYWKVRCVKWIKSKVEKAKNGF